MCDQPELEPALSAEEADELEKKLCEKIVNIYYASNLGGVVHGMSRDVHSLYRIASARGLGTDFINQHPVMVLYAERVGTLTRFAPIGDADLWGTADAFCREKAGITR